MDIPHYSSTNKPVLLPSTPFTCAQRVCNKLTFLYCSPGIQTPESFPGLTPLTNPFTTRTDPQPGCSSDHSENYDPNSTLDILKSLDDPNHDQGIQHTSSDNELKTEHSDKRIPLIRLKRWTLDKTNLSSQTLKVEKILTYPLTPNKRNNTKRALDSSNAMIDSQPPSRKCKRLDEGHSPITMDIVDFAKGVTAGTLQGNTHPRTPTPAGRKYQKVPEKRQKKVTNRSHPLPPQDEDAYDTAHFFLDDKTNQDKDDWYIGRREFGCATKHASRRSYLRQAYQHELLTDWSTSHVAMPPWLRDEDLDTKVFEIKAKAGREIMKEGINYLSGLIEGLEKTSAESLARVEKKFTPEELLASRAALTEHGRIVSEPLKQTLSEKREYLRRNQPSLDDLLTMRH